MTHTVRQGDLTHRLQSHILHVTRRQDQDREKKTSVTLFLNVINIYLKYETFNLKLPNKNRWKRKSETERKFSAFKRTFLP